MPDQFTVTTWLFSNSVSGAAVAAGVSARSVRLAEDERQEQQRRGQQGANQAPPAPRRRPRQSHSSTLPAPVRTRITRDGSLPSLSMRLLDKLGYETLASA